MTQESAPNILHQCHLLPTFISHVIFPFEYLLTFIPSKSTFYTPKVLFVFFTILLPTFILLLFSLCYFANFFLSFLKQQKIKYVPLSTIPLQVQISFTCPSARTYSLSNFSNILRRNDVSITILKE